MTRDPAQCGRTFPHRHHDTTDGWCPGLNTTQVRTALADRAVVEAREALAQPTLEDTRG